MEEKHPFVSCMKIKGVPILPPLITPARKKELQDYKKKAILLEKAYQLRKDNRTETKCSKIMVGDEKISNPQIRHFISTEEILEEVDMTYVPYEIKQKSMNAQLESLNLCISNSHESNENVICNNESPLDETFTKKICGSEEIYEESLYQKNDSNKPRLLRSNSYTLDTPSTILLDHLRKQNASSCESSKLRSVQLETYQDISTTPKQEALNVQTNIEKRNANHDLNISYEPSLQVITTDITVQQINFTTTDDEIVQARSYGNPDAQYLKNTSEISANDPEVELQAILQQIPENYAKKIMTLIEEQRKEQLNRTRNYEHLKAHMLQSGDFEQTVSMGFPSPEKIFVRSASNVQTNRACNTLENSEISAVESTDSHHFSERKSLASSLNESQTLPFDISTSSSESLDNFSLKTFRILDLDGENRSDSQTNQKFSEKNILIAEDAEAKKELDHSKQEIQRLKEEKAATIIGAYMKGYLVRRLMNTAKVKTIIQTIQDALLCALELQNSETIGEADVELHRKLIKLVSSACFDFHDIFFGLSVREQMEIIAMDREKRKKTVAVKTTLSNTEIRQGGQTPIRYTKSLTHI